MVEKEVDQELVPRHVQAVLAPDEGEACAQLQEETGQVVEQGVFQLSFVVALGQGEEVEGVGVFEGLTGEIGQGRGQGGLEIGDGLARAQVEATLDLVGQDGPGPVVFEGFRT